MDVGKWVPGLRLTGHEKAVNTVSFSRASRESTLLATGSDDSTAIMWDLQADGEVVAQLRGHSDAVRSVHFCTDGGVLATGSVDKTVALWHTGTGKHLHTLDGHSDAVMSCRFAPRSTQLASGSCDRTIRLSDSLTGQAISTLRSHTDSVYSVCFSNNGALLASCGFDATVLLWDVRRGSTDGIKPIGTLKQHGRAASCVHFSADDSQLASSSWDHTIMIWDVRTQKMLDLLAPHHNIITSVRLLLLPHVQDHDALPPFRMRFPPPSRSFHFTAFADAERTPHAQVCFAPTASLLASSSSDSRVVISSSIHGTTHRVFAVRRAHFDAVLGVDFSPCGGHVASVSDDMSCVITSRQR